MNGGMSAIGPKQTSPIALHMSAFGGKADITQEKADIVRLHSRPLPECYFELVR
jgi:hypothetical protein